MLVLVPVPVLFLVLVPLPLLMLLLALVPLPVPVQMPVLVLVSPELVLVLVLGLGLPGYAAGLPHPGAHGRQGGGPRHRIQAPQLPGGWAGWRGWRRQSVQTTAARSPCTTPRRMPCHLQGRRGWMVQKGWEERVQHCVKRGFQLRCLFGE